MGKTAALERQWEREDRDPSLWPVPGVPALFRIYMKECPRCRSKFSPKAQAAHERKCGK